MHDIEPCSLDLLANKIEEQRRELVALLRSEPVPAIELGHGVTRKGGTKKRRVRRQQRVRAAPAHKESRKRRAGVRRRPAAYFFQVLQKYTNIKIPTPLRRRRQRRRRRRCRCCCRLILICNVLACGSFGAGARRRWRHQAH